MGSGTDYKSGIEPNLTFRGREAMSRDTLREALTQLLEATAQIHTDNDPDGRWRGEWRLLVAAERRARAALEAKPAVNSAVTFQCRRCKGWFPPDPNHYGYADLHECLPTESVGLNSLPCSFQYPTYRCNMPESAHRSEHPFQPYERRNGERRRGN